MAYNPKIYQLPEGEPETEDPIPFWSHSRERTEKTKVPTIKTVSVDTSGSSFVIDMDNSSQRCFVGSNIISEDKSISFSNVSRAKSIPYFRFEISGSHSLIFEDNVKMSDALFNLGQWTNIDDGEYEMSATYDSDSEIWYVKIIGPFN